jgi:membrane-associated phospholipid phosphatase
LPALNFYGAFISGKSTHFAGVGPYLLSRPLCMKTITISSSLYTLSLFILCLPLMTPVNCFGFERTDSIPMVSEARIRPITARSFILPGALVVAGSTLTFAQYATHRLDSTTQGEIQEDLPGFRTITDNFLQFAPTAAVFALNAAGVKGKHSMMVAAEHCLVAFVIMAGTTELIKNTAHVRRPDGTDYKSFTSGHTATAFSGAEFLHQEYGQRSPWYSAAGYASATATGLLRMANNRHWLGDVIAGAGIGILSTRVAYWLVPKINKALQPGGKHPVALHY